MTASKQLHTLVNIDTESEHGTFPSLTNDDVVMLSGHLKSLRTVISTNRCWTVSYSLPCRTCTRSLFCQIYRHPGRNEVKLDRIGHSTLSQFKTVVGQLVDKDIASALADHYLFTFFLFSNEALLPFVATDTHSSPFYIQVYKEKNHADVFCNCKWTSRKMVNDE